MNTCPLINLSLYDRVINQTQSQVSRTIDLARFTLPSIINTRVSAIARLETVSSVLVASRLPVQPSFAQQGELVAVQPLSVQLQVAASFFRPVLCLSGSVVLSSMSQILVTALLDWRAGSSMVNQKEVEEAFDMG